MLDIPNIGMGMRKSKWWFVLAFVLIAAGAYGNSRAAFGDTATTVLIAAGVGLLFSNALRLAIYRDNEAKMDEMARRISGASSDVAFVVTIAAIGVLSAVLSYYPALMNVQQVLVSLLGLLVLSKLAAQFYYKRMKKEI